MANLPADEKTPWSLRKHKGSVACYSDVVNADGHPVCCAHDDYAALIVAAVNAYRPAADVGVPK